MYDFINQNKFRLSFPACFQNKSPCFDTSKSQMSKKKKAAKEKLLYCNCTYCTITVVTVVAAEIVSDFTAGWAAHIVYKAFKVCTC